MRLKKAQKEFLLTLIAEGLQSNEINERAALFDPPFDVSKSQVSGYRTSRHIQIQELIKEYENEALNVGLAKKNIRVFELQKLAKFIQKELYKEGTEWSKDTKAMIDALRGVVDDIAKEMGGRVHKTEHTGEGGDAIPIKVLLLEGLENGV